MEKVLPGDITDLKVPERASYLVQSSEVQQLVIHVIDWQQRLLQPQGSQPSTTTTSVLPPRCSHFPTRMPPADLKKPLYIRSPHHPSSAESLPRSSTTAAASTTAIVVQETSFNTPSGPPADCCVNSVCTVTGKKEMQKECSVSWHQMIH